jgi:hypothetical protein
MHRLALLTGLAVALALAGCNCENPVAVTPDTGARLDGAVSAHDGAVQEQDGAVSESDASQEGLDASVADLDGALSELDGAVPEADGSITPIPDGSVVTETDGSVVTIPDGSVVTETDGSVVTIPDGSVVTVPDGGTGNHPPVVTVPATYVVLQGASLTMTATGSDPDGDPITYAWLQTGGTPTVALTGAGTASASFTAPAVAQDVVLIFTVTVCDPQPLCASVSTLVTINMPPGLTASGNPSPVNEGALETLTATAYDPGDTLTYQWTQSLGPTVTLSGTTAPVATFTAPLVSSDTALGFDVQVCDAFAACSNASVSLTVKNVNHPPVAVATAAPNPAGPLATVTLDASGSTDPDAGDVLNFLWTQSAGPTVTLSSTTAAKPTFTAPVVQADTVLTFDVKVCDQLGECSTTTVSVTVLGVSTYVSEATGSDATGQGTKTKPWRTVQKAITTAVTYAFTTVYVDKGNYPAAVTMVNGVAVQCGYDSAAAWARTGTISTLVAGTPTVLFPAGANATLDGCTVNVFGVNPISDTIAVNVLDASPLIVNCTVDATVASSGSPPPNTIALALGGAGAGGVVTVSGGTFTGGNGSTSATGIRVQGGMALTIGPSVSGAVAVYGTTKVGTASAYGILATAGTVTANQITASAGPATSLSVGISASGAASKIDVTASTIKSGDLSGAGPGTPATSDGVAVNGIASATITRCLVNAGSGGYYSNGVRCTATPLASITACSPVGPIAYGVFGAGSTIESFGVRLDTCPATLTGNTIRGGNSSPLTAGVDVENGMPNIQGNVSIEGGSGNNAVGVLVRAGTPSIVSNTLIRGALASGVLAPLRAAGISAAGGAAGNMPSATITDNVLIEGGYSQNGAVGILLVQTRSVTIARNTTVRGGTSPAADWGVADGDPIAAGGSGSINLTINRNLITGTPLDATSTPTVTIAGGLYLGGETGLVSNNRILGGFGSTAYGVKGATSMEIWNNYVTPVGVVGNTTSAYGFHMQSNGAMGTFNNNIIDTGRKAYVRNGFYENGFFTPVAFKNNDFYPDPTPVPPPVRDIHLYRLAIGTYADTVAVIDATHTPASAGTMVANPLFVNEGGYDFHLTFGLPGSPCIGAGLGVNLGAPKDDMDGDSRPLVAADIGPDEVP